MPPRRFPPPWSVEESDACLIVKDRDGQKLAYVSGPAPQANATPRARFGFHVASIVNNAGQLVASAKDTQALWNIYPESVQRWINEHGGLSRHMIFMGGRSLSGIVAACDPPTLRAVLAAGAAGYSGTLKPIVPDQPSVRVFTP